jgi:hypothetical protein
MASQTSGQGNMGSARNGMRRAGGRQTGAACPEIRRMLIGREAFAETA